MSVGTECASQILRTLVAADGDVAVVHAGDKPYMTRGSEQIQIARTVLSPAAVETLTDALLPASEQQRLDVIGAMEYRMTPPEFAGHRFSIVASRANDDFWLEVRHVHPDEDLSIPDNIFDPPRPNAPVQLAA